MGARLPAAIVFLALLVMLLLPSWAGAGTESTEERQPQTAVDRWHRLRHYYSMDPDQGDEGGVRFGICPGIGLRAGNPGTVFGVADIYISVSRHRSFSLFAGAGVEGTTWVRSAVFTLGWGGVRRIHVARHQTGFFGAFLRYRDFVGKSDTTRRDAVSVGTEVGAGHMDFTFELGASRRQNGDWNPLVYVGFKVIWAVPLGW